MRTYCLNSNTNLNRKKNNKRTKYIEPLMLLNRAIVASIRENGIELWSQFEEATDAASEMIGRNEMI